MFEITYFSLSLSCWYYWHIATWQWNNQICPSSLLSDRNVRWSRRMLPLVSHGVPTGQTDRRTERRTPDVASRILLDAAMQP